MATDHAESNGLHERFGLTSNIDREADGRPMLQADEELFGTFAGVSLLLGGSSQGDGTLYVSTRFASAFPSRPSHSFRLSAAAASKFISLCRDHDVDAHDMQCACVDSTRHMLTC